MSPRRRTPILVGRRTELAALDDALAATRNGLGAIVVVDGEAGIGKSRLIEDFVARADGALAVTGNCVDAATDALAYAPWTELLWWLVREIGTDALGPERAQLARLLPELGNDTSDGESSRDLLFEAIVEVLHRCASACPLIVVIEDIHWIDPASRDVLLYVARNLRRLPLLLIVTHRPARGNAELDELLGHLSRFGTTGVALGALADEEAADIAVLLSGADRDTQDVASIVRRSEGNPLFVEEFVAASGDEGLPSTIRHLMLSRFNSLSTEAKRLVEVAAVIGDRAPHAWLVAAAALPNETARRCERESVDSGVLVAASQRHAYAFAHSLLRQAVLDHLLAGDLVVLHESVARALGEHPVDDDEIDVVAELAHHWDAAGNASEALRWTGAAAEQALRRYAFDTALALFERALRWWDVAIEARESSGFTRAELLFGAADAAGAAGRLEHAADLCLRAIPESRHLAEAFSRSRPHLWAVGRSDELLDLQRRALVNVDDLEPHERAVFLLDAGYVTWFDSRPEAALDLGPAIIDAVEAVDEPALHVRAYQLLAMCHEVIGEPGLAESEFQRAISTARHAGLYELEALVVYNYASFFQTYARHGECLRALDALTPLIEEHGIRRLLVAEQTLRAEMLAWTGELEQASTILDGVHNPEIEGVDRQAYVYARALVALLTGDFETTLDLVRADDFQHADGDDLTRIMALAHLRADALSWSNRADEAAHLVDTTIALLGDRFDAYWLGLLALGGVRALADVVATRASGTDIDLAARDRADSIASLWQDMCKRLRAPSAFTQALSAGIDAEYARLHREAWPEAARDAATAFEALGIPYYVAYFELLEAHGLISTRDRRSPAPLLVKARATAVRHGFAGLRNAIERTARAEQIRLGRVEVTEELLSPREVEVLRLMSDGLSNPEIAEMLIIGRRTVRTHVSNILTKLGSSSRAEAVSVAHKRNIL